MWNDLIKVMNTSKVESVRKQAKMLLGQLNTAGSDMIKREIQRFLDEHLK